jgi:hypothetical protein
MLIGVSRKPRWHTSGKIVGHRAGSCTSIPHRNVFSSRYSNNMIQLLGISTSTPKIKTKNKRQSNVENVGLRKTTMSRSCCAYRRYPTTLLTLQSTAYKVEPSGRNTTTTMLLSGWILGFPPVCAGARKEGFTQCPSGRKGDAHGHHRVSAGQTKRDSPGPRNPAVDVPSYSTTLAATTTRDHGLADTNIVSPWQSKRGTEEQEGLAKGET